MNQPSTFRVLLQKEQLVFSAAHFITFAGDICECLHGHNYECELRLKGFGQESLCDRFHRVSGRFG